MSTTNPVGSGPYMLDTSATVTGTSYVYTKNPDYWNPDVQHYDNLTINVLTDPTAALNAIKAGEANGVKLANNDTLAEVEGAGWTVNANELDFQGLLLLDRAGTHGSGPRQRQGAPGDQLRVRPRRPARRRSQSDHGTVTTQVFPATSAAYDKSLDTYYTYDPEKAKELLTEAGYPNGLTIKMPTVSALGATTYTLVAQQLADVGHHGRGDRRSDRQLHRRPAGAEVPGVVHGSRAEPGLAAHPVHDRPDRRVQPVPLQRPARSTTT